MCIFHPLPLSQPAILIAGSLPDGNCETALREQTPQGRASGGAALASVRDRGHHGHMSITRTIIGLGEALFDVFPDQTRLGGAPLNVAVHAEQLGNRAVPVTRVGQDTLGEHMLMELRGRHLVTDHIQTDPDHATGTVLVDFDERGEPVYRIVEDVAWDFLQWDGDMAYLAQHCDAVCFGSLAQRVGQSRNTIYRFLDAAQRAVRLFDVNLRQHYHNRDVLGRSCELATAIKLNTDEISVLGATFNLGDAADHIAEGLIKRFSLKWVALTRGALGTVVYTSRSRHDAPPVPAEGKGDPVGAGDATAAALLHGVLRRWDWPRTIKLANTLGAYVASQDGACPVLGETIQKLAS